jgi:hypothetical protein
MDIEQNQDEEKPLKTALGIEEQLDLYKDRLILRKKGLESLGKSSNKTFKPSEVASISIKPAGTLFDGKFELTATNGIKYTLAFKSYAQPEFEDIKFLLSK